MAVPTAGVVSFTHKLGASLGMSEIRREALIPQVMRVRNAFRDTAYMAIDFPWIIRRITSSYGYYRKYLRQMRKNGRVNPEDFKDADLNELRLMINTYFHTRGPVMKIDFRIFNYIYFVMIAWVLVEAIQIQQGMDAKMESGNITWDRRRSTYDDDYEEDIRG